MTWAGLSALATNVEASSDHSMTSIFSRAALADGRADRIETLLTGCHGHLGAAAGLAGDGFDLDRAAVDLRHFQLEETAQETLVRAAHVDLRALGAAADLEHEGLDVLADAVVLQRRLLRRSEDRLRFAHVEDDRARLDAGDRAGHQVAFATGKVIEDDVAFRFVEPLEDDLLGSLGVDPPERFLIELLGLDQIAGLRARLEGLSFRHADLGGGIFYLFHDHARPEDAHLARLGVDANVDVLVPRSPAVGGLNRLLDGPNQLLA
jgi:hypothetical protein